MASLSIIPASINPANIPDGLKPTWLGGPEVLTGAQQQTVIQSTDGSTVFVFSYIDNRVSLAFVKYVDGRPGTPVEKTGSRYAWAMGLDPENKVVTVSGQSNALVTATFDELGIA